MKKFVFALFLSVFFTSAFYSGSVYAQEKEQNIHNSNALYFYFINGYAVSYKFKSEGNSSYRLRLDFSTGYSDGDGTSDYYYYSKYDSNYDSRSSNQTRSQISISVSPQYFYNIYETNLSKIYFGCGPYIAYSGDKSNGDSKQIQENQGLVKISNEDTHKSYSIGISAILGIETYLTHNISVFAETQLNGGRSWNESKYSTNTENINNHDRNEQINYSKSWSINLDYIRIGLGIYF